MSIWIYEDTHPAPTSADIARDKCLFCHGELECYKSSVFGTHTGDTKFCFTCGWWCRSEIQRRRDFESDSIVARHFYSMYGACAQLRNLDIGQVDLPLTEVRAYLLAKYESRLDVHPRVLEELVATVFRDHGYLSEATAYQKDGGIDVILSKPGEKIGVQVKRYRNRIECEQIRALAGALVLGGHTSGIFVTTSKFRSGACSTASAFTARGIPIALIDADAFYDSLRISSIARTEQADIGELLYSIESMGESQVIYENDGPY